jgi:predicted unusual protein kinase regulating ubiquinone biosynthesis (AarF/ABC1/UbiB family)
MEGMGHILDPQFDMMAMGESLIGDLIKIQTSPARFRTEMFKISKDLMSLLDVLPRTMRWALRKFARNDYALEVRSPDLVRIANQVDRGTRRLARAMNGFGLLLAGAILIQADKGYHWEEYSIPGLVFGVRILSCVRVSSHHRIRPISNQRLASFT